MITYEKGAAPSQKICLSNQVKTDLRGLGTGVGGFSNLATTMYAMEAQFDPAKQPEQRAELRHRIKLLREIVGQEIDRIKGTAAPIVPAEWKKMEKVHPEDTDAEKAEIYKRNSMVICKKPYFFRYLYPELNKKYKQYESSYNQMCLSLFGDKIHAIMKKENKTNEEKTVVRNYIKYCPLITSNCTMNTLCREFEDIDFDITYKKQTKSLLPTCKDSVEYNEERLNIVRKAYQKYNSSKQITTLRDFFDYDDQSGLKQFNEEINVMKFQINDSIRDSIREELSAQKITPEEILFYSDKLSKHYKQFNWGFCWDILDTQILKFIPQSTTYAPVRRSDVSTERIVHDIQFQTNKYTEYLGEKYILKNVSKFYFDVAKALERKRMQEEKARIAQEAATEGERIIVNPIENNLSTEAIFNSPFYKDDSDLVPMGQSSQEQQPEQTYMTNEEFGYWMSQFKDSLNNKTSNKEEDNDNNDDSSNLEEQFTEDNFEDLGYSLGSKLREWFDKSKNDETNDQMDRTVDNIESPFDNDK